MPKLKKSANRYRPFQVKTLCKCKLGYPKAQYNLGVMYANGEGVPKDDVQAYLWFNLAAAQGDELARTNRDNIEKQMTKAQIAKAQKLIREWKPQNNAVNTLRLQ